MREKPSVIQGSLHKTKLGIFFVGLYMEKCLRDTEARGFI